MQNWLDANQYLAAWLEALGTVGALAFIAETYRRSVADRRRHQAKHVVLRIHRHDVLQEEPNGPRSNTFSFSVENASTDQITGVVVAMLSTKEDDAGFGMCERPFLGPRETYSLNDWSIMSTVRAALYVEFRDADGRGWRRHQDGRLTRRRHPRAPENYTP